MIRIKNCIFFIGVFWVIGCTQEKRISDTEYLSQLDLSLQGTIVDIEKLAYGHDCGVVRFQISNFNQKEFDDTNLSKRFLGKINEKSGEIICCNLTSLKIGRIFNIEKEYLITTNNKNNNRKEIILLPSRDFPSAYREVRTIMNVK